jgi:hypothetical protein
MIDKAIKQTAAHFGITENEVLRALDIAQTYQSLKQTSKQRRKEIARKQQEEELKGVKLIPMA